MFLKIIFQIYEHQNDQVKYNENLSDSFSITNRMESSRAAYLI